MGFEKKVQEAWDLKRKSRGHGIRKETLDGMKFLLYY